MSLLIRYAVGLLGVLLFMGGGAFAWRHYVAEPYREAGRAEVRAKLMPVLQKATDQLNQNAEAFKQIEGYMVKIKADDTKLKKQVEAAQGVNAKRKIVEVERIKYIDRVVLTGATECERTKDAIRQVLR